MIMQVVFLDGSSFVGKRGNKETGYIFSHETKGTHHFTVLDADTEYEDLIGLEVAVPINVVKYFVLNYKCRGL